MLRFIKHIFITNLQSIPPLLKHIFVTFLPSREKQINSLLLVSVADTDDPLLSHRTRVMNTAIRSICQIINIFTGQKVMSTSVRSSLSHF